MASAMVARLARQLSMWGFDYDDMQSVIGSETWDVKAIDRENGSSRAGNTNAIEVFNRAISVSVNLHLQVLEYLGIVL